TVRRGASSLRIGVSRGYFSDGLNPEVEMALAQAVAVLPKLSFPVQGVTIPVSPDVNATVMSAEGFAFHAARVRDASQLFQPAVLGRLRLGETVDTRAYIERRRELDQMRRAAPGLFANVDLLVTPTVPLLPGLIAATRDDDAGVALFARN